MAAAEAVRVIAIPSQLRECRFIRVAAGGKEALDTGWQELANYGPDAGVFRQWLEDGGNYGILLGGDVCCLDADNPAKLESLFPVLGNTFTVRTGRGGMGGLHVYFRSPGWPPEKIGLVDPETGEAIGDLRGPGSPFYTVGPGSLHPSGRRYEVVKDAPLAVIDKEVLEKAIAPFRQDWTTSSATVRESHRRGGRLLSDVLGLSVENFLRPDNARVQGDEVVGVHPVHGSETGQNFHINRRQDVWHCFRCNSGGGPLEAMAVSEGIIRCDEARPGCLEGHWREVFDALRRLGYGEKMQAAGIDTPKKENKPVIVEKEEDTQPVNNGLELNIQLEEGNFITSYTAYGRDRTDAHPEYHMAAALCLLSVATQRKVIMMMQQGPIYPNVWLFLLGASTISRKSTVVAHAIEFANMIASDKALPQSFSPEGFLEDLADKPRSWFFKEEAAGLIAAMEKAYMAEMRDLFCEIYDCGDFRRKLRRGQRKDRAETNIKDPFVVQLMATTPDNFRKHTTVLDLTSGWLVRFLYFYPTRRQKRKAFEPQTPESKRAYNELLRRLRNLYEFIQNTDEIECRLSFDALPYFQGWQLRREAELLESDISDAELAFFGRMVPYVLKLAILFKVGSDGFIPEIENRPPALRHEPVEIEIEYVQEAVRCVDEYFLPMSLKVATLVRLEEEGNLQNKILDILREYGGKVKRRDLLRKLHLKRKDIDDAIEVLCESEEIEQVEKTPTGKRPYILYRLIGGA